MSWIMIKEYEKVRDDFWKGMGFTVVTGVLISTKVFPKGTHFPQVQARLGRGVVKIEEAHVVKDIIIKYHPEYEMEAKKFADKIRELLPEYSVRVWKVR